ncbi:RNA polymerase sigma factor [Chitinophaga defluvii]|uniref:RNA polymerase sigma factor n=1 Tax=Chitinophaga defluvii TaxID=3163343 RepID=A0ABV2T4P7_9BACT
MTEKSLQYSNDVDHWAKMLEGDHDAFNILYERYFPMLFRYALRFTTNRSIIKDLLQDLFTALFLKGRELPPVHNPRSYLLVATRRKVIKKIQQEAKISTEAIREQEYDFRLELSADNAIINKQSWEQQRYLLEQTLSLLTRRQKEAIYLRFYEEMSYDEIAEVMSLKEVKYARTLVYRALTEMREQLRKKNGQHGLMIS